MKRITSLSICVLVTIILSEAVAAQDSASIYNKNQVFDHSFMSQDATEFRSSNGAPGPKYWQNIANYVIHSTLMKWIQHSKAT